MLTPPKPVDSLILRVRAGSFKEHQETLVSLWILPGEGAAQLKLDLRHCIICVPGVPALALSSGPILSELVFRRVPLNFVHDCAKRLSFLGVEGFPHDNVNSPGNKVLEMLPARLLSDQPQAPRRGVVRVCQSCHADQSRSRCPLCGRSERCHRRRMRRWLSYVI